jgi:hypothetical protein
MKSEKASICNLIRLRSPRDRNDVPPAAHPTACDGGDRRMISIAPRQVDHGSVGKDSDHILDSHPSESRYEIGFERKNDVLADSATRVFKDGHLMEGKSDSMTKVILGYGLDVVASVEAFLIMRNDLAEGFFGRNKVSDDVVVNLGKVPEIAFMKRLS